MLGYPWGSRANLFKFAQTKKPCYITWSGIEVVITGLTRNHTI